jgi:hypothetical protein
MDAVVSTVRVLGDRDLRRRYDEQREERRRRRRCGATGVGGGAAARANGSSGRGKARGGRGADRDEATNEEKKSSDLSSAAAHVVPPNDGSLQESAASLSFTEGSSSRHSKDTATLNTLNSSALIAAADAAGLASEGNGGRSSRGLYSPSRPKSREEGTDGFDPPPAKPTKRAVEYTMHDDAPPKLVASPDGSKKSSRQYARDFRRTQPQRRGENHLAKHQQAARKTTKRVVSFDEQEEEEETVDRTLDNDETSDDDEETIASSVIMRSNKRAGFLDWIHIELLGALDDTSRSFEQVMNVFTLQEEDILAVTGHIDKAKREMSSSLDYKKTNNRGSVRSKPRSKSAPKPRTGSKIKTRSKGVFDQKVRSSTRIRKTKGNKS